MFFSSHDHINAKALLTNCISPKTPGDAILIEIFDYITAYTDIDPQRHMGMWEILHFWHILSSQAIANQSPEMKVIFYDDFPDVCAFIAHPNDAEKGPSYFFTESYGKISQEEILTLLQAMEILNSANSNPKIFCGFTRDTYIKRQSLNYKTINATNTVLNIHCDNDKTTITAKFDYPNPT
jgi:hypothetical protein